jgi:hypothetical protein
MNRLVQCAYLLIVSLTPVRGTSYNDAGFTAFW